MATVEENIVIKCPADKVFAYTTDVKNWSKWQPVVTDAEQTSQGQMDIGTTFRWTSRDKGVTLKWTGKVTEYEPNRKSALNVTGSKGIIIEEHSTYDPIEGGTKVTFVFDVKVGGLFKVFSSMLISSMQEEQKKSLNNLKNILEAQN